MSAEADDPSASSELTPLSGDYRDAFVTCRKHRLDLNLLYDLDPKRFMDHLSDFINQVSEVDYLNLFVSSLK